MKGAAWGALLALSVAVALFFEWHTDEVTVVLAVMSVMAVVLGVVKPERGLIAGTTLGYSVLAAHALTEVAGTLRPRYLHSAIATGDWIAMAILGLWIVALAWFGGWLRTRLELSHAA
jgi:hypothetical protein